MSYGFQKGLPAEFPSQVVIDVTEVCNLACIHCPHPTFKAGPLYSAAMLDPALNAKAIDEVGEHGAQFVRYTSEGEPLVHPQIYDMLDYAVQRSKTFVTLTTNGTTLVEKRVRKLLESGLHMVDVSIDAALPDTYEKIRKGNLFLTRLNVLRLLTWARNTPTKVVVSFIEQPENRSEVDEFRRFWTNAGAHEVVIRRLHSAAGAVIPIANVMRSLQAKRDRYPCLYPWERIVLTPRGTLSFCPADWTHGATICDYRTTTIKETWDAPFYRRLRVAHMGNDFSCHQFCGQCPDWAQTRWPWQGESYSNLVEKLK